MDKISQLKPLHLHSRKWQYEKKTHVMAFAAGKFGDEQSHAGVNFEFERETCGCVDT